MDEHTESAWFVWARRAIAAAFLALAIGALVSALCACKTERAEKEQTIEREKVRVTGTVAGMPSDLTITRDRQESRQEQVTSRGGLDPQLVGDIAQAASGGLMSALLPGVGGLLMGLLPSVGAWLKARSAGKALEQAVDGIEEAKQTLPQEAQDQLHSALSRRMDAATKARVKRIKARRPT